MSSQLLFWSISAGIILFALGATLYPLLKTSRLILATAMILVGSGVLLTYRLVGTPAGLEGDPHGGPMPEVASALAENLRGNPNDAGQWLLLARTYAEQGQRTQASEAFAKAALLRPDDADVLVDAAEARLYAHPQKLIDAEGVGLLERAVALQPHHQRGRWFLGVSQRQNGQPADAANTWEPLLPALDGETRRTVLIQINTARREAGLPELEAPEHAAASTEGRVILRVSIAPNLARRAAQAETVYVYARQVDGPPMPVAAKRLAVSSLPATVSLDDAASPMPTMRISALGEVEVVARISYTGGVGASKGDLQSKPTRVRVGRGETKIVIDQVVP